LDNLSNEKSGIHRILNLSFIYNFVQFILGSKHGRNIFVSQYIRPVKGEKILDFGCGTGNLFKTLNGVTDITYVGIEPNKVYVDYSKKIYKNFRNAHFFVGSTDILDSIPEKFDTIVVSAVLHHLKTNQWSSILGSLYLKLNHGGKIVLLDIVYHPDQHLVSRFIVSLDRGVSVLNIDNYLKNILGNYMIVHELRTDLMRIPYSHIISTIS
jgi:SAM-dependent methyltransferase